MKNIRFAATVLAALSCLAAVGCKSDPTDEGTPFRVISVQPGDQQTNVPQASLVSIRFTNPPDHRTILGTKQVILVNQSNSVVPITFQFSGEWVHVTPGTPLAANATYGIAVRPGVQDVYGNNIETPFAAEFATGPNVATIPNWPPFTLVPAGGPPALGLPGTLTPVAPLFNQRARHTATRLEDGRVLVVGGEGAVNQGIVWRSAEIYDPVTVQWTMSSSNNGRGMNFKRVGHTADLLANGRVLIAGGSPDGLQALDTAEIYDPNHDAFYLTGGKMHSPRMFHSSAKLGNGNLLLVCGLTTTYQSNLSNSMITDTLEVFDSASGTFHLCGPTIILTQMMSGAFLTGIGGTIYHGTSPLPNGKVLITGGLLFINGPFYSRGVNIYDPGAGVGFNGSIDFTQQRMMNQFRFEHTQTLVPEGPCAGLVIITGGMGGGPAYASAEVFDYLDVNATHGYHGTFKYLSSNLSIGRRSHTATHIPSTAYLGRPDTWGKMLVVGGNGQVGTTTQGIPYPPHLWPFVEPGGCGACTATNTADIFDPFSFGQNTNYAYRGIDLTGQFKPTTDPTGAQTFVPNVPFYGTYWHTATGLKDGSVLIAGGMDCVPCMGGPADGIVFPSCCVYTP